MAATSAVGPLVGDFIRSVFGDLAVDAAKQMVWTPIFLPTHLHDEWQVGVLLVGALGTFVVAKRLPSRQHVLTVREVHLAIGRLQFTARSIGLRRE